MSEAALRDDEEKVISWEVAARLRGAVAAAGGACAASVRRHPWLVALLLAYAALLFLFRPAMPFEWDEVLFQRALDDYNVAGHSPHPPGYPAYVGAAKVARLLVGDPLLALQLVGILAAVATLGLAYWLTRRLGGTPWTAAAAATLVAAVPGFTFHANVGLSDVASAGAGAAAMALLLIACERGGALPWGAAAAALALGVRPQLVPLLVPLAMLAVVRASTRGEWRRVAAAAVAALVVTDVVWLSAIYATGPSFWGAWSDHARTLVTVERPLRLPGARLADVAGFWLVRPFGSTALAWGFWAFVVLGAAAWLRAGKRLLVAACLSSALLYIGVGMFTMNFTTGARYVLPAIPVLGVLAAGVLAAPWRVARRALGCALAIWCTAAVYWAAPVYALRRQAAPAWASLVWVREHLDPAQTTVVFDGFFEPHAQYVLQPAGFTLVKSEPGAVYGPWLRTGGAVVYLCPKPVAGGEVLFRASWKSDKLRWLTRNRYDEAAVTRAPGLGEPVFSPEWRVRENDWELWGTGAICIGEQTAPRVAVIRAGDGQLRVRRAGAPALAIKPGAQAEAVLMPGPAGCLLVNGPSGVHSHFPPVQTLPLQATSPRDEVVTAAVVPLVAAFTEPGRAEWRSDVWVHNVGNAELRLVARYLPGGRDNGAAPAEAFTLPPGGKTFVANLLATTGLQRWGSTGALVVLPDGDAAGCTGEGCGFTVFSRTYNVRAPRLGQRLGEGLPAIPLRRGLYGGGRATFDGVSNNDATTGYVSVATWIPTAVRARLTLRSADKREIATSEIEIPPFGHVLAAFPGSVTNGQLGVQLVKPPAKALFYPAVTQVNAATGEPTHLLATPSQKTAPPEWLTVRPRAVPVAGAP